MGSLLEHGRVAVGRGEHPALDEIALPAVRGVSRAVEPLVVLDGDGAQLGQPGGEGEHPLGQVGMEPHPLHLARAFRGPALSQMRVGDTEPTEVVDKPGPAYAVASVDVQPHGSAATPARSATVRE